MDIERQPVGVESLRNPRCTALLVVRIIYLNRIALDFNLVGVGQRCAGVHNQIGRLACRHLKQHCVGRNNLSRIRVDICQFGYAGHNMYGGVGFLSRLVRGYLLHVNGDVHARSLQGGVDVVIVVERVRQRAVFGYGGLGLDKRSIAGQNRRLAVSCCRAERYLVRHEFHRRELCVSEALAVSPRSVCVGLADGRITDIYLLSLGISLVYVRRFPALYVGPERCAHQIGEIYVFKLFNPIGICGKIRVVRIGVLVISEWNILLTAAPVEHVAYLVTLYLSLHFEQSSLKAVFKDMADFCRRVAYAHHVPLAALDGVAVAGCRFDLPSHSVFVIQSLDKHIPYLGMAYFYEYRSRVVLPLRIEVYCNGFAEVVFKLLSQQNAEVFQIQTFARNLLVGQICPCGDLLNGDERPAFKLINSPMLESKVE